MRDWLKNIREKKGLKQIDIANELNITESYYCMIENEKRNPSVKVAKAAGAMLGFNWTKFYDSTEQ